MNARKGSSGAFGLGLPLRALCLLLAAVAIASPAAAQNIYVSENTGYNGSPPNEAFIGEFSASGATLHSQFITVPTSEVWGAALTSGPNLFLPHWDNNQFTSGVSEYNANTGAQVSFSVGNLNDPHGVTVAGNPAAPYLFVLYGSGLVGEYSSSNGATVNASLAYVTFGEQLVSWTDTSTNTSYLYVSSNNSGSGLANTGSIQKIVVNSSGVKTSQTTLVSGLNYAQGLAISGDGHTVYVITEVSGATGALAAYDSSSGAQQWSRTITGTPFDVAAYGAALFVTRNTASAVGEYYASSGAPINETLITGLSYPTGIIVGVPSCARPPANMTAWYTFDQTGTLQEDLANENTATAHNNTSIVGEVARALQFNGTNAYVEAPSQSTNNLGTSNFSIDAWVKIANSADDSGVVVLLDKRDASFGYHLYIYAGKPGLQLSDSSGFSNYTSTTSIPADNQWHLIAVTVARTSHTGGQWYLDGAPKDIFDPSAHAGSLNSTSPLDIGVRTSAQGGGGYFKGSMDELEIFARALGPTEIFSLMQAGPAGKCKCATPPSSMVAWYAFDQSGSSQSDLAKGNTATAVNTTSGVGEVAGALGFNGTNAYVQAPAQSWLNMGTGDLSIDVWVNVTNNPGVVSIVDKRDSYPNRGYQFFLYNRKLGLQLADSAGYSNYVSTTAVPADGQWHLIAVTVTRSSRTGGVWYLDGAPIDTPFDPTTHPNSLNSSAPLSIGVSFGGEYLNGWLDELEIFNRALSSNEVLSLMQAGSAGKCKN